MLYQVCRWWLRYCSVLYHRLKLKLHLFDLLWICCTTYSQQSRTNRKKCSLALTQYCSSLTMANKNTLTRLATFEHFTIHAALDFVHICKVHMESAIGILLRPVGNRCIAISLSVCLSAREDISGTAGPIFTKIFMQIPVAVTRSSSGGVAIRYVLLALWMASRWAVIGRVTMRRRLNL